MIRKGNLEAMIKAIGYIQSSRAKVYEKKYVQFDCVIEVDFNGSGSINYPEDKGMKITRKTTCNFSQPENFVVLECITRLMDKGYRPEHIELEKEWTLGHSDKGGFADILVKDAEGKTLFIVECKTAGNESAMLNFRDKYRNIDVLLIDDIQFIIGKESTQEEFFHTFNHLHTLGKQIIISSDKPPKDIETLESRLRTRFEWGLIADISSPDYETRMAILQKKIELDHLEKYNIKNDVLDYIAANVKSNIRELEGSLNKLIALYKLNNNNNPIDIALAAEALKDIISSDNRREVTPELILDIVADHFGITVADLKSKKRDSEIAVPRQICMYLMRTMTDTALKGIGAVLGGKDHSTVKYGVEKIAKDIESDEMMANTINIIKKKINPA